jgi:hypothetical protein
MSGPVSSAPNFYSPQTERVKLRTYLWIGGVNSPSYFRFYESLHIAIAIPAVMVAKNSETD